MAWFARSFIVAVAATAGIATSQLPEFGQQYRQRLGGAIDELSRVVAEFDADAARHGVDREMAIAELAANPNALARDRGRAAERDIDRLDRLEAQAAAFETAGPGGRLVALAQHYDPALAEGTFESFEPAVPVTLEGIVAGGAGMLVVLALIGGLSRLGRRRHRHHEAA